MPHTDLIKQLNETIDLIFAGGKCKYIIVNESNAYWANKITNKKITYFTKSSLKDVISLLIQESYFKVGNKILLQKIGIPMGIDPAPFWANLYLHRYEYKFMVKQIKNNTKKAYDFHACNRFIDDICCINDKEAFGETYRNIYPKELELKCENLGNQATFLDLDIKIIDNKFTYKLFDKRDNFPFHIVRMPHIKSNIPKYVFYGSILSEYLRIARSTLEIQDFRKKIEHLYWRMIDQGAEVHMLHKQFKKALNRHPEIFKHFCIEKEEIANKMFL